MNSNITTQLASGYSSNLEDFVTSPVEITDGLGNPVTNYYLNSDYYVKITFSETAILQFEYFHDDVTNTDYMTYQLPPQLKVRQSLVDKSPFPIIGESLSPDDPDPVIGSVSIDINGLIKVHFDDVDINGNPALVFDEELQDYVLVNFIDYYSDASFLLDIAAQFSQVGIDQNIDFGNNVIVTVTVEDPLPGTLSITKTNNENAIITDKEVTFTITLTASDGPVHGITLSDSEQPDIGGAIKKSIFKDMLVSVNAGTPYTPPEFASLVGQLFGEGFNLSFPDVTLNPGEQIVVNFVLDIEDVTNEWLLENPSYASAFGLDFWLFNRAVAQGLDEYETPVPPVTANSNAHVFRLFLFKAGVQDLTSDYTVKWNNWSVGDGVTPLNGCTITDTFTGLVFGGDNLLPNGEHGVSIAFKDQSGATVGTEYLTVAAGATDFSFTVPIDLGTITTVTLELTFSTIVADTSDFDDVNTVTYYNTITVDIGGSTPSITAGVAVTKPGRLPTATKTGAFGSSDGNEIDYVEWTINLYVPKEMYGHPISFIDDSFVAYDGLHRLYPRAVPENVEIKVYSEALGEQTLTRNVDFTLLDPDHTNGYAQVGYTWYVFFIGDTTGIGWGSLGENSIWPYDDDTWLTMTFRIPLDTMAYDSALSMPLLEALQRNTTLSNYLYINNYLRDFDVAAFIAWPLRKIATVSGDTIKYQIYFYSDDFDFSYTDVFTDTFDPMLEYVPFSMRVWRGSSSSIMYGLYEMVADIFTDMLDESMSGNTMSFDFLNMYRVNWGPDGASYYPSPTLLSDNPVGGYYCIEYTLKLKEDAPLGEHEFVNHVSLGGFTNFSEATIGNKVVDKTMSATSNRALVTIIINPGEKTLDGESGQYTVTDILSDTLSMYISTIKVEAWESGVWVTHPLTASASGDLWTYTTSGANQISFVVPDSTMLRITYEALVKGAAGNTVTIGNEVTVLGQYYDSTEDEFLIIDTRASGTGTRTILTVIKHDQDEPDVLLSGAIFAIYIGVAYSGWDTVKVPSGIDRTITAGSMTFYYFSSGVAASNGQLVFNNQWLTPTHMAIYALKEYQSALGYEIPAEPIRLFSYTVPTDAQQEALVPYTVQQVSDTISIPNTKQEDWSATIHGHKAIIGDDAPDKIFTFHLTQVTDPRGTEMTDPYTDTTTTLGQGDFGFPLSGLIANTTYYYKITENTDPSDTGWIYDSQGETGQIVTVSMTGDGTATVYYPNDGNNVTFTNEHKVIENPTQIILTANKMAIGTALPAGRFLFGLFDESGNIIDTAANAPAEETPVE